MPSTDLTIDRLFDAPALAGPAILGLKIAPDGSRVTFLQGKAGDKDRLDLWEYDVRARRSRLLVDCDRIAPQERLSEEERSRRERLRTAALSGIVEYSFAPSGRALLFPLGGDLYHYDLDGSTDQAPTRIARFVSDAAVSPGGRWVAYVRDQNLYACDLERLLERALTHDGGGPVKNGVAEFVAQEEMDRATGYWWSPDDAHVAFTRIDETPVRVVQRFEIAADNVTTLAQRYPEAGSDNVAVRLGVVNLHQGVTTWIDLGSDADIYLARVDWLPDGKTLAIQRQSRDQRRLDLLFADVTTGESRVLLTETSATWVDLNDELTFLQRRREFIWLSSRDGFAHLYLYDLKGRLLRRLTAGSWNVDDFRTRAVKAVDEAQRLVYFAATAHSVLERHLYRVSLDGMDPYAVERITQEPGVHRTAMAPGAGFYVDTFSSAAQPPQVSLRRPDGTLIEYLLENRLDAHHPDAPYLSGNAVADFGVLAAADGQELHYRIFKPVHFDAHRRYPAILDVYGGPGVQRVLNDWMGGAFVQILTRAGFIVLQLDNRGTAHRGDAFKAPLRGRLGAVEVAGQVLAARWLGAQPFVDPGRIGVWGWSYGGYLTLMLMFQAPEVFKAGLAGAPVTDWSLYDTHYTERYLGRPQDNPTGYAQSSVLTYAGNLEGDLLIMHGMADDNVLFLHSTKLFRRLQDLGKPFLVMVYPGAKHALLRQHDGRHGYAAILKFFEDTLRK